MSSRDDFEYFVEQFWLYEEKIEREQARVLLAALQRDQAIIEATEQEKLRIIGEAYEKFLRFNASTMMALEEVAPATPPAMPEFFLAMLLPSDTAAAMLGDFSERFAVEASDPKIGERNARVRYWGRALRSVGPLTWACLKRLGVIALVINAIKRFAGG